MTTWARKVCQLQCSFSRNNDALNHRQIRVMLSSMWRGGANETDVYQSFIHCIRACKLILYYSAFFHAMHFWREHSTLDHVRHSYSFIRSAKQTGFPVSFPSSTSSHKKNRENAFYHITACMQDSTLCSLSLKNENTHTLSVLHGKQHSKI